MIKVKLSEICDLQNGYAFKSSDYVENSNTLSCRMSNIRLGGIFDIEYNPRFLPDSFADQYKGFLLKDGDLVIAMTDLANDPKLLGVPTLVQTDGRNILLNQRVGKLIIKDSSKVDNKYLQHVLNDPKTREYYRKFASGGLQINLGKTDLLNVEIPLPPLAEQRRIASILDQADELRQKRQQAIEKLDQLLQATFIDMFGDPVSNPKGWQIEPLKNNILHANNGLSRRRKELENVGDIVLRLQDVHYDGIHFDKELNRISLDDSEKKRFSVDEGDILFIRVNGNPEYVGRSAVFSGYKEPIFHNDHLIRIKLSERYIPNFLSYCFNTPQGKNIISKQIKTSAGQHTVSQGGIEIMKFYIPPIKLQEQWANLYLKIEDQKKKLNEQLDMQNQLFSSLQNQAFNGTL
ncbi:restriction endonuclease subunit S [Acinetobacter bohemicus]|uniref:restriction endonuclease subunit S n=1 Tax=Acinetobacter TaxID=469 RepID=UPI00209AE3FA|nr:restriction endonuclease subunit S [Acinetobacter bohemicus]MCO8041696.1 restriction endonuclease subunit S [Acinetobacter sp. S4400-12]MCU7223713.1 restriction endonuclease subunit S [Acinetobacter bohemicus]